MGCWFWQLCLAYILSYERYSPMAVIRGGNSVNYPSHCWGLSVEIIKRSDAAKGFQVLPRRWVVERTLAWLNRCRRLAKDFENLSRTALAFVRLASIRLMLRKLCNPA